MTAPTSCTTRRAAQKGTFERTAAGLRRLQAAAQRKGAPLRVSINTTVAHESLDTLDQMVDVAEELGVDAIGLNHLMYSTPDEVDETLRLIGETDAGDHFDVRHRRPGVAPARVRARSRPSRASAASAASCSTTARRSTRGSIEPYYTPGAPLDGRCLYPFLHARVSFSGKVYFCPFIRVEVGDLTEQTLEEVWNGERYVDMRQAAARERTVSGLPPLLQGGTVAGRPRPLGSRRPCTRTAPRIAAAGRVS